MPDQLRGRIADQFAYRGESADVWRVFDLFLETASFLNLGYSPWYLPHVVGSSQRRLAARVGQALRAQAPSDAERLLDVGCGRGGPAVHFAERFGFRVTGVDLVRYNVARAIANAGDANARFVVGDATALPLASGSVDACSAVDSLVYVADRPAVAREAARTLRDDGVFVLTDLVSLADAPADRRRVDAFAEAWDMPRPATVAAYRRMLADAGFSVRIRDLTPHSVGRFRKWTGLFLAVLHGPLGGLLVALFDWYGLDPVTIRAQVRAAHEALPALGHVLVVAGR